MSAERLNLNRKCCSRRAKDKHPHARDATKNGRVDAATGYKFKQDQSTTKAVLKRMKALGVVDPD